MKKGICPNGVTGALASHSTWSRPTKCPLPLNGLQPWAAYLRVSNKPRSNVSITTDSADLSTLGNHPTAGFRFIGLNMWVVRWTKPLSRISCS
jgi:hypothetical protein